MDNRALVIKTLRKFEVSNDQRSLAMYLFTVITLLVLVGASAYCYSIHPVLSVFFWIPSGLFLCRFFVLQHDCGHHSFFTKSRYNKTGGLVLGFFTMIPSNLWNHIHNVHHGIVGNLNKRKMNPELWTMTVNEYLNAPIGKRMAYRIMRSWFMRLFVTPALWMIVPRIPLPHLGLKIVASVLLHDLIYGVILYFILVNDLFPALVSVYLIPLYIFNFMASVFFYLQHQYEHTSWEDEKEWDLYTASIEGSSHLVVGPFLAWVSGNVGCHHIHHLNTRIPSYQLDKATHEANRHLDIEPIYMRELFRHLSCVLWDEQAKKLVPFRAIRGKVSR